jgi:dipeptidyl aminopeptidase/acylaminoacyl peptidase
MRVAVEQLTKMGIVESSKVGITGLSHGEVLALTNSATVGMLPGAGAALVVATVNDSTNQGGFFAVDLATYHVRRLREENAAYGPDLRLTFDVSREGRAIVFGSSDAQHPPDLWVTDSSFRERRQVTDLNSWARAQPLGDSRLVSWLSADGERLQGALLLPALYDPRKRYPLVALVYAGGKFASGYVYNFGLWPWDAVDNMQLLATRGYAVLLPDLPQKVGTPMLDIAKGLLPGINKVIELGIADPARLGIMGQSYGGYTTLSALVQSPRFKAAVVRAGPVDLVSNYGAMQVDGSAYDIGVEEDGQGLMRGTPWQFRERYLENSPMFYLDRVQTPVLIIHGTEDPAVPVTQGDELFVGLRRLGAEVEYARYSGEGHGLRRYVNRQDYVNRMLAWFEGHLK